MKSKLNQVLLLALCFSALLCCTFQVRVIYGMPFVIPLVIPRFAWSILVMVAFFDIAWLWIAKEYRKKNTWEGYALLLLNLLAAGAVWLGNNPQLVILTYLAIPVSLSLQSILLVKPEKEQFLKKDLPEKWILDLFLVAWGKVPAYRKARKQLRETATEDANRKKTILAILAACLAVIPFAVIAVVLLSSADSMFAEFFDKLWVVEDLGQVVSTLLLALIGGFAALSYFYFYSGHCKDKVQTPFAFSAMPKNKPLRVPAIFSVVFLMVMNVIYTIFSVIQFLHVFRGNTPDNVTLSEYVVSGFWQLIFLTVMNLLLLAAALYFTEPKNAWGQRIMSLLLIVNNTVMGVSAFVRLSNYETAYGFTIVRLYGYFLLVLIGLLLIFSMVKICFCHFPLRNAMFWTVAVFGVSLLFFPTNGFVAQQNVDRYLQNPEKRMDMVYLEKLGKAAIPALEELKEKAPQETVRREAEQILSSFAENVAGGECDTLGSKEFTDGN